MSWTEKQVRQLKKDGMIKNFHIPQKIAGNCNKNGVTRNKIFEKRSKEKEWLEWNLMFWANEHAISLEPEYKFDETRKWRFDWAFPGIKAAVEYEGIFSEKSRHTTKSGYAGDVEKYNAATIAGWRVIRLTAKNYKSVLKKLNELHGL